MEQVVLLGAFGGLAVDRGWIFRWELKFGYCGYNNVPYTMFDWMTEPQCRLCYEKRVVLNDTNTLHGAR